jgi:hypothetical protein
MNLSQERPPENIDEDLGEFLVRRFIDVGTALDQAPVFPPRKQMPYKPQLGHVHYFGDPTIHDYDAAITSEGFWGLTSEGWVPIGATNRVKTTTATFVSATGAIGTVNTAETVLTRSIPANALKAIGDRIRIRTWFVAQAGPSIVTKTSLGPDGSEVAVGDVTHTGGAAFDLTESWVHYIDNTHGNIIEQEAGAGIGNLTAVNVPGFIWNAEQNIIVAQSAVAAQFITVYGLFVDIFPVGK